MRAITVSPHHKEMDKGRLVYHQSQICCCEVFLKTYCCQKLVKVLSGPGNNDIASHNFNIRSQGCVKCQSLCWLSSYGMLRTPVSLIQLKPFQKTSFIFLLFTDFQILNLRKTIHQRSHLPYFLEFSMTQSRIRIFHPLWEECPSFSNQTLLPEKNKSINQQQHQQQKRVIINLSHIFIEKG